MLFGFHCHLSSSPAKNHISNQHPSFVSPAAPPCTTILTINQQQQQAPPPGQSRSIASDEREQKHHSWSSNPSKLTNSPSQGENSGPYNNCYDVSTCSPHSSCLEKQQKKDS
ncbi:hypothetical protein NC651_000835 [Populus alba x Populus x berolinensis]|nr:hypothetical protein NC651_000835 [Populus alba x Populus x berolinensis]